MSPLQIESTRNSIDIHRRQISLKRLKLKKDSIFSEGGNHGHIVSRLLKAFGSPLCEYGIVLKTLDTLIDIVDSQSHLVTQLVENDICLLLVSWLGQSKRNTSSEIPIKILKCILHFLEYSKKHNGEISRLLVDGFLYENLDIIFRVFNSENCVILYVGRILRHLAEAQQLYDDEPSASKFLEYIATTLLDRSMGVTVLFDFCYGVKDWNIHRLNKKIKPLIEHIVDKIFSGQICMKPKTVRQFLTLILVSSLHESKSKHSSEPRHFLMFKSTDKRKENRYLIDAAFQCFLNNHRNHRLTRQACATLCILLERYYELMGSDRSIMLYSLCHPVCEVMIQILTEPTAYTEGVPLQLVTSILQVFVLLFPQGCLFRKQLLQTGFIRFTYETSSSSGCGCGNLLPCGLRIVCRENADPHLLVQKWLPLIQTAQLRCQQFRQKSFRLFLQKGTFTPSIRRGKFPSISLIFSNVHVPCLIEKKGKSPMAQVFFSKIINDCIASFL